MSNYINSMLAAIMAAEHSLDRDYGTRADNLALAAIRYQEATAYAAVASAEAAERQAVAMERIAAAMEAITLRPYALPTIPSCHYNSPGIELP